MSKGFWGQSLWDIALEKHGTIEAAWDWLEANDDSLQSLDDEVPAGLELSEAPTEKDLRILAELDGCKGVNSGFWPGMEDFAEGDFRASDYY